MTSRVFIDGAAGTTGLEIRDRLKGREEFELIVLDEQNRKDERARKDALHEADIAILCLPDDAAREAVKLAEGADTRFIDASSAHRVDEIWVYGLPELVSPEMVAHARRVSNPGCYASGFLALLSPLVEEKMIPNDFPISVNAMSGYSGGGKALIERYDAEPELAARSYGLTLDHKHLPEMQAHAGLRHAPVFTPTVVPAYRGMIVDIPIVLNSLSRPPKPDDLRAFLAEHYAYRPVISVLEADTPPTELLIKADAEPWDGMELGVFSAPDNSAMRLTARFDNLGKGAAGAAVQNLNLMCGLPETTGLHL